MTPRMPSQTFDYNLIPGFGRSALATTAAQTTLLDRVVHRSNWSFVMEFLSASWWSALLAIILINLVLAGDNAIVIAMAARSLPQQLRTRAVVWGSIGAVMVRSAMTLGAVWLLQVPGLMLAGGIGLLWIAYRLLVSSHPGDDGGPVASTFWAAMKTIIVADTLMGIDNVLGVAGAAHGQFDLVVIGLFVSVPIVVLGSTLVLRLVQRFPMIIHAGAAVLAFTAAKMIIDEPLVGGVFDHIALRWGTYAAAVAGVLTAAAWAKRRSAPQAPS
jgi:YjbE family integral membrane protein